MALHENSCADKCFCVKIGYHLLLLFLQISHEAPVTGGFGAEISASIVERCFLRVTTFATLLFAHLKILYV